MTPRQPHDIAELRQGGLLGCGDTVYPHTPSFLNYRQVGHDVDENCGDGGDGDDLR